LTLYSAHNPPALFHAGNALGLLTYRDFPLPIAATSLDAPTLRAAYSLPVSLPESNGRYALSGFEDSMHSEGPFTSVWCYPGSDGRASLGLTPSRISLLESRSHASTRTPFMGFATILSPKCQMQASDAQVPVRKPDDYCDCSTKF
jgi:hypothetical protein